MKLVLGILSGEWDNLNVTVGNEKFMLDHTSMGGKSFNIKGEVLHGIILECRFFVCRIYKLRNGTELFGFISRDIFSADIVTITTVGERSEKIVMKRKYIKNYHVRTKRS